MLKTEHLVLLLVVFSTVNAQIFLKVLDRETIKKLQLEIAGNQLKQSETTQNTSPFWNSLRLINRGSEDSENDDAENIQSDEMEEEIIAEDEDGNMFLLIPKDLFDSTNLPQDLNTNIEDSENNDENDAVDSTENVEDDDDEDEDEDEDSDNNNDDIETDLYENGYNIGRGHKKRKIKRKTVHAMNKPFRKWKRIIRLGFKHPKLAFKKALKAIILPKSAMGILTSSMFSNAVGFGSGSLAGMTAGTIAGGIASGIFRNFGSLGRNEPLGNAKNVEGENNDAYMKKLKKYPIAYYLAQQNKKLTA